MPTSYLCEPCRELSETGQPQPAHSGMRLMLALDRRSLYRCRHCGAFATSPDEGETLWSFNLHGQAVEPGLD